MKKKLSILALATMIWGSASTPVWAESDTSLNQKIESRGFIGFQYVQDEQEGGDINTDTMIGVLVPTSTSWFVTETTQGQVKSPTYSIRNLSERANLRITFEEYRLMNDLTLPGELTLNLTDVNSGRTIWEDIKTNTNHAHSDILMSIAEAGPHTYRSYTYGGRLDFKFSGSYSGQIPATALQPRYEMVMEFSIDSYTIHDR